jgi:hypothetical protein
MQSQCFIKGWHAVYTKPGYEQKISGKFSELGIGNLFPSYIFVYLSGVKDYNASIRMGAAI